MKTNYPENYKLIIEFLFIQPEYKTCDETRL